MEDFLEFLYISFSAYLYTTSKRERGGGESKKEKKRERERDTHRCQSTEKNLKKKIAWRKFFGTFHDGSK